MRSTRRGTLAAAVAAGAAGSLGWAPTPRASAGDEDEAELIAAVIAAEQACVVAYGSAGAAEPLRGPRASLLRLLRDQDSEHVGALAAAQRRLGGEVPPFPDPGAIAGLSEAIAGLGDIGDGPPEAGAGGAGTGAFAALAIDLESAALRAQLVALRRLGQPRLLVLVAAVMASDAQHLVLLRQAAGASPREAVPQAFEAGVPPPIAPPG